MDREVGRRIRELRESRNYSREGFARQVDISAKFLYEIEMGRKGFSADVLCRIAKGLSVSCDTIMFGADEESAGRQNIIRTLEMMEPRQISKMQSILVTLYEVCESTRGKKKR